MDLAKTRRHIGLDHGGSFCQRFLGRFPAPGIGAEMISAKNHQFAGQPFFIGNTVDEADEVPWRHAGISAEMIDLIAGCLDQHRCPAGGGTADCGAQNHGMGGADGGDAGGLAGAARGGEIFEYTGHRISSDSCAARKASSSERLAAPSIGPRRVTLCAPAALA